MVKESSYDELETRIKELEEELRKHEAAEDVLRESENRLRALLDFLPYPTVVFTLDGRVYYLNPSFTNTFGWTLQELEGKTIPYVPSGLEQETREGAILVVRDCGVGIIDEAQRRIFEGFFTTQETLEYSSKRPFDFNAGGKGADLLRMKIFSERYNFKIDMESSRCRYLQKEGDICPGRIDSCAYCVGREDCHVSGGATFSIYFPPIPKPDESVQ